jgi:ribosomal protein S18 acetylase RimI-like enzyme
LEIKPLSVEHIVHLPNIISGYRTTEIYQVGYTDNETTTAVTLTLTPLNNILHMKFPALSADDLDRYRAIPAAGFSFGLFTDTAMVGIVLAEPHFWNSSLWVHEFHIADGYRGQGWGKLLMTKLIAQAQAAKLRIIICETQNKNIPAIRFYRRMGFRIEGVDISYYSNHDLQPDKEVAVFMKRRLGE